MAVAALTPAQIVEVAALAADPQPVGRHGQRVRPRRERRPHRRPTASHAGEGLRSPYTGAGIGVAVIDTGADSTHPDLAAVITYNVTGDPLSKDGVVDRARPDGRHLRPRHARVSSTIAGSGAASRAAATSGSPRAPPVHSFKTDAGAVLLDSWALRVFDWILTHPEANIRVSSNSWGSGDGTDYEPDDPVNVATKMLYDAGVTVVFAASNSGGPDTLNQYATSPWVVSVAASDK